MKKIDATPAGGPAVDAARVELMLGELRLPGIKMIWAELAARADKEGSGSPFPCRSGRI